MILLCLKVPIHWEGYKNSFCENSDFQSHCFLKKSFIEQNNMHGSISKNKTKTYCLEQNVIIEQFVNSVSDILISAKFTYEISNSLRIEHIMHNSLFSALEGVPAYMYVTNQLTSSKYSIHRIPNPFVNKTHNFFTSEELTDLFVNFSLSNINLIEKSHWTLKCLFIFSKQFLKKSDSLVL